MSACRPPGTNPGALPLGRRSSVLIFNTFWILRSGSNRACSRFCAAEILRLQQVSNSINCLMLNLKEFREVCRVENLVPNQMLGTPVVRAKLGAEEPRQKRRSITEHAHHDEG